MLSRTYVRKEKEKKKYEKWKKEKYNNIYISKIQNFKIFIFNDNFKDNDLLLKQTIIAILGLLVYDSKKLAVNYIKSKNFLLDLFSLMPLELIQLWYGYSIPILRFPRFFKLYRTVELYYITESRTLYPNVWRVANLTHILFCLGHWFAGFYFLISKAEGFKGTILSLKHPLIAFPLLNILRVFLILLSIQATGAIRNQSTSLLFCPECTSGVSIGAHWLSLLSVICHRLKPIGSMFAFFL